MTKAEVQANRPLPQISSPSHSQEATGSLSAQTSESGHATPASDSISERGSPSYSQHHATRFADARLGLSRTGHDEGEGGEMYELDELHDDSGDEDVQGSSSDDAGIGGDGDKPWRNMRRRPSDGTVASFQLYTPDEEKVVIRKFDRRLVMFLGFCYMLSFVDRSNIGNARIAGMESDLQSQPPQKDYFAWAIRSFYITYVAFEWMSLLWRVVPPHIYVSLLLLSWGVIASLQAVVTNYPSLIVLRALLGIGEAGFTGVPFYLSFFFKRRELAFRTALFISAAPLASAFAGFVAWFILWIGESSPIASWRLLFLLEGFPSIIVSTIAWGVIPDSPESASYLTPRERKIALLRLRHEKTQQKPGGGQGRPASSSSDLPSHKSKSESKLSYKEVLAVFKDPTAWLTAGMFFLANTAYSTLPAFLPTILEDMGHTSLKAEALSAPPMLLAFVLVLLTAHVSDRLQSRSAFIVAHAVVSGVGYVVLAVAEDPVVRYVAVYPAAVGFFNVVVLVISWGVNNQPDESRRGGGFALLQVVGQAGPLLVGSRLYPDSDAPFFHTGMAVCAGAMFGVALLAVALRIYLAWLNRRLNEVQGFGEVGVDEEVRGLFEGVGLSLGMDRDRDCARAGFRYML